MEATKKHNKLKNPECSSYWAPTQNLHALMCLFIYISEKKTNPSALNTQNRMQVQIR
jgi:hypothetical protein